MPLQPGFRIGPYEILGHIGSGGMGEVYRGHDTRLRRDVAVKLLSEHTVGDADRLARFHREARAIAALSHPNILTVFDTGHEGGRHYLVTEILEGETLRSRLKRGALPPRKAVEYAAATAEGLAAAHQRGVVHRDVKPENLFLTRDGRLKVLDFGLAALVPELDPGTPGSSPTLPRLTSPGMVMGTLGYLAPEQARGGATDHRADIFSLGAVLHEMLTGHRVFQGAGTLELLTSVLRDEPGPPSLSNPQVPHALDSTVLRCLAKDPEARFQSARDLAFHLAGMGSSSNSTDRSPASPAPFGSRLTQAAGLLLVLALPLGIYALAGGVRSHGRSTAIAFQQLTDFPGEEREAHLAPGGTSFAFVSNVSGNLDIHLQRVSGRKPVNLTADSPAADTAPAFSPDGERIAFRSERDGGGIYVMGSTGESVKRLTDFGFDPAWSPDGQRIVFSTRYGQDPWSRVAGAQLWVVRSSGGEIQQLTREGDAVQPRWSPGGRRIAFWGLRGGGGQRDIWTIPADSAGEPAQLEVTDDSSTEWNPVWSPDGHYLYFASDRGGSMNVWRIGIDEPSGHTQGTPEPVTTPSRASGSISLSSDGRLLAYVSTAPSFSILRLGLDPASSRVTEPPRDVFQISRGLYSQDISPDGKWIAFTTRGGREDLYVIRSDGTGYRQLTDDAARDRGAKWSPDGARIGFYSDRGGRYDAWAIRPDGSSLEQLTRTDGTARTEITWSPDGNKIATYDFVRTWIEDLTQPLDRRRAEPLPVLNGGRPLQVRSWAPDGGTLAGGLDFYTTPNSVTILYSFATGAYRVLPEGRGWPVWMNDSQRLAVAQHDQIVALDTRTGASKTLVETTPHSLSVSRDSRWLSWLEDRSDADVWLATLDPRRP